MGGNMKEIKSPREFIEEMSGIVIDDDNCADDCDMTWDEMTDWMFAYANHVAEVLQKDNV
jgi:hypothetical protein